VLTFTSFDNFRSSSLNIFSIAFDLWTSSIVGWNSLLPPPCSEDPQAPIFQLNDIRIRRRLIKWVLGGCWRSALEVSFEFDVCVSEGRLKVVDAVGVVSCRIRNGVRD